MHKSFLCVALANLSELKKVKNNENKKCDIREKVKYLQKDNFSKTQDWKSYADNFCGFLNVRKDTIHNSSLCLALASLAEIISNYRVFTAKFFP